MEASRGQEFLSSFCSLLYFQCLEQCLSYRKCWIDVCWNQIFACKQPRPKESDFTSIFFFCLPLGNLLQSFLSLWAMVPLSQLSGHINSTCGADNSTGASWARPHAYYALSYCALILAIVFGNGLVCVAVLRERALQTTTNYLVVSLAVADLLVATLVMPWVVYLEVSEPRFGLPTWLCLSLSSLSCWPSGLRMLSSVIWGLGRKESSCPSTFCEEAEGLKSRHYPASPLTHIRTRELGMILSLVSR